MGLGTASTGPNVARFVTPSWQHMNRVARTPRTKRKFTMSHHDNDFARRLDELKRRHVQLRRVVEEMSRSEGGRDAETGMISDEDTLARRLRDAVRDMSHRVSRDPGVTQLETQLLDERDRRFVAPLYAPDTEARTLACPVCFDHAPAVACVPCGHVTCNACHQQWSAKHDACAVCRTRVETYVTLYM